MIRTQYSILDVIGIHYPELIDSRIEMRYANTDSASSSLGMSVGPNRQERGYQIDVMLPPELPVNVKSLSAEITGLLAHELAHIVLGHGNYPNWVSALYEKAEEEIEDSRKKGRLLRRFKPSFLVYRHLEKSADREVIRRGLGHELIVSRQYMESYIEQNGEMLRPEYYSSMQLKRLSQKLSPKLEPVEHFLDGRELIITH